MRKVTGCSGVTITLYAKSECGPHFKAKLCVAQHSRGLCYFMCRQRNLDFVFLYLELLSFLVWETAWLFLQNNSNRKYGQHHCCKHYGRRKLGDLFRVALDGHCVSVCDEDNIAWSKRAVNGYAFVEESLNRFIVRVPVLVVYSCTNYRVWRVYRIKESLRGTCATTMMTYLQYVAIQV